MGTPATKLATWEAVWEAEQAGLAVEVIDGVVVEKASPTDDHGAGQLGVSVEVGGPFARKGGRGGPGGWWLDAVELFVGRFFGEDPPEE